MNERGLGPATSRELWRLNSAGLLALRKERGTPLANRQVAAVIAKSVDHEQHTKGRGSPGGAGSPRGAA